MDSSARGWRELYGRLVPRSLVYRAEVKKARMELLGSAARLPIEPRLRQRFVRAGPTASFILPRKIMSCDRFGILTKRFRLTSKEVCIYSRPCGPVLQLPVLSR